MNIGVENSIALKKDHDHDAKPEVETKSLKKYIKY